MLFERTGLIHRDICPDNFVLGLEEVSEDGTVAPRGYLIDLDLSVKKDRLDNEVCTDPKSVCVKFQDLVRCIPCANTTLNGLRPTFSISLCRYWQAKRQTTVPLPSTA